MKYLASTHVYVIWVAQSYSFYERKRSIVHGGERDRVSRPKNCGHVRDMVDF